MERVALAKRERGTPERLGSLCMGRGRPYVVCACVRMYVQVFAAELRDVSRRAYMEAVLCLAIYGRPMHVSITGQPMLAKHMRPPAGKEDEARGTRHG